MKTRSQRGKSNRERGARGEREFRHMIIEELGDVIVDDLDNATDLAPRNLNQVRDGGTDFICIPGWSVECRNRPSVIYISTWMDEVVAKAIKGTKPALAYRKPRRPARLRWWVEVRAGDILPDFADTATADFTMHMLAPLWFAIVRGDLSPSQVVNIEARVR